MRDDGQTLNDEQATAGTKWSESTPMTVVAFSGGDDSTAMALRMAELGEDFSLLFTPAGNELPELFDMRSELDPENLVTLTEEQACADCAHQIYDHRGGECRVRREDDVMCKCQGFRFKNEGRPQ